MDGCYRCVENKAEIACSNDCGRETCNECKSVCDDCEKAFCGECTNLCDGEEFGGCSVVLCGKCSWDRQCSECQWGFCPHDAKEYLRSCGMCGEYVCVNCVRDEKHRWRHDYADGIEYATL